MKFSFLTHLVYDFKASHIIGNFLEFKVISKQFAILPYGLISLAYCNARQKVALNALTSRPIVIMKR